MSSLDALAAAMIGAMLLAAIDTAANNRRVRLQRQSAGTNLWLQLVARAGK